MGAGHFLKGNQYFKEDVSDEEEEEGSIKKDASWGEGPLDLAEEVTDSTSMPVLAKRKRERVSEEEDSDNEYEKLASQ